MKWDRDEFLFIERGSLNNRPNGGANSVVAALRHNKREYDENRGKFDHTLSHLNYTLLDTPATANEVLALKEEIQKQWGFKARRVDDSVAMEVIFSLRERPKSFDMNEYFSRAAQWVEKRFSGRLLSVDVHLDEPHPHCHAIILLDVGEGKGSGTTQIGYRNDSAAMTKAFFDEHAKQYGLKVPPPAMNGVQKKVASWQVHEHLRRTQDPGMQSPLWPLLSAWISKCPGQAARELGITLADRPSMSQLAASPGRGAKTAAGEAAQDRRAERAWKTNQQGLQGPGSTEAGSLIALPSEAPTAMGVGKQTPTAMGVAMDPLLQPLENQQPSSVGVHGADHLPQPLPSGEAAVLSSFRPVVFTRDREDDHPAAAWDETYGDHRQPTPPARRHGAAAEVDVGAIEEVA